MKSAPLITVLLALLASPLAAFGQALDGRFFASSLETRFAVKGTAWGTAEVAGHELVVSVDSLWLWRDPARGRDGGGRAISTLEVGLASGSQALAWNRVAQSEPLAVDVVLQPGDSTWIRDVDLRIPLTPEVRSDALMDTWLVFSVIDRVQGGTSHLHSEVRFSGESSSSMAGLPEGFEEGIGVLLDMETLVGRRHVSVVDDGVVSAIVRRLAEEREIPVCVYDESARSAFPSFRVSGVTPGDEASFQARVGLFESSGGYAEQRIYQLTRVDGMWTVSLLSARTGPVPIREGQAFCHGPGRGDHSLSMMLQNLGEAFVVLVSGVARDSASYAP